MEKAAIAFGKKYSFDPDAIAAITDEIENLDDKTLNTPMALPLPATPPQEQPNGLTSDTSSNLSGQPTDSGAKETDLESTALAA